MLLCGEGMAELFILGKRGCLLCVSQLPEFPASLSPLQPDLCFILVSGKTGNPLGGPVKYSINGEGKLIGPQAHITSRGAIYILFGFGKMGHRPLPLPFDLFSKAL